MKRTLVYTPRFVRDAKRFLKKKPQLASHLQRVIADLMTDAFAAHLKTHKLKGALAGRWSTSAGYDLRIVFRLIANSSGEHIELLAVGTHDDVY